MWLMCALSEFLTTELERDLKVSSVSDFSGIPMLKYYDTAYVALTSSALARIEKGGSSATASLVASLKKLVSDNKIAYKHIHEVEFIDAVSCQALS